MADRLQNSWSAEPTSREGRKRYENIFQPPWSEDRPMHCERPSHMNETIGQVAFDSYKPFPESWMGGLCKKKTLKWPKLQVRRGGEVAPGEKVARARTMMMALD